MSEPMSSIDFQQECEEYEEYTENPETSEDIEEEMARIWGKNAEEVEVEEEEERSVFIAKFSAVCADTIERPEWDIDPPPPPANWVEGLPVDIPWNSPTSPASLTS